MMNQFQTLGNIKCSRIKCKLCQFATEIPVGGLRQLPRNLLMVRKIEQYRNKIASENYTLCSLCYEETRVSYMKMIFFSVKNWNIIRYRQGVEIIEMTANHIKLIHTYYCLSFDHDMADIIIYIVFFIKARCRRWHWTMPYDLIWY